MEYYKLTYGKILFLLSFSTTAILAQENDSLADTLKCNSNILPEIKTTITPQTDKWFAQDKFLHFYFSASMVGLSYHTLICRLNKNENEGRIFAISFTAFVGLGKEIYDKKKKNRFSWKDLCWDGIGILTGYLAFIHDY